MSTNVEQATSHIQTTGTVASSPVSTSGPKISMFAAKSGFVIPKNKLSGSLIPIFRGGKKGGEDSVNEESAKQVQRKTKWGPDLMQDTAVRKGRALAYQTRVDQITQQLSSGTLDSPDNHDLFPSSQSASNSLTNEKSKLLEIEKREAIGEILKLNPAYKAPADYRPLLKEEKVPIPIKDYPGFDFIGLILGTAKDTQKRLEKETGAKIRVYGKKGNTRDEVEVTASDGNETPGAFEELHVHVSADTYEKVDAAVALIELLVTPVSVNTASCSTTSTVASGENDNRVSISQSAPSSETSAVLNQGQTVGSVPTLPQGNFEMHQGPWFHAGLTHTPVPHTSGYMAPPNSSAPQLNHPAQVSSAPFGNMPSVFGPRPVMASGFASVTQNPQLLPSRPHLSPFVQQQYGPHTPLLGNNGTPRNPLGPALQSSPSQSNFTNPAQYCVNQTTPTGSQPMVHSVNPSFLQSSNPAIFPNGPPAVNISPSNMAPVSHPSNPHIAAAMHRPMPPLSPPTSSLSQPLPHSGIPNSASPNFSILKPPFVSGLRPQQPNSSDFTFQPHRPQIPGPQMLERPGGQSAVQNMPPSNQTMLQPQSPSLRPAMRVPNHPPAVQGFQRPQISNQISQPRSQMPTLFVGSPAGYPVPIPNQIVVSTATMPQMQPRNFNLAPLVGNPACPFSPRAGNQMQFQQHFPAIATQPRNFMGLNQQLNNNFLRPGNPASGRTQQVYDPFSPTSLPFNPQLGGDRAKVQKQESDPEYEDLMASVGVK